MDLEKNYRKYVKYLKAYIKRDGLDKLLTWLDHSDAIEAPASTQYHMSVPGGFIQHSLNVFNRLIRLIMEEYGDIENSPYSKETIALVSLLHDISKINFYEVSLRNVKNPQTGQWEHVPYFTVRTEENRLIFGTHEENSVYMLNQFFKLSYEEALAVRWHGGCGTSNDPSSQGKMMEAYRASTLALLLHFADMQATCIDEVERPVIDDTGDNIDNKVEETKVENVNETEVNSHELNSLTNTTQENKTDDQDKDALYEYYHMEDFYDGDDLDGRDLENSIDEVGDCPF